MKYLLWNIEVRQSRIPYLHCESKDKIVYTSAALRLDLLWEYVLLSKASGASLSFVLSFYT